MTRQAMREEQVGYWRRAAQAMLVVAFLVTLERPAVAQGTGGVIPLPEVVVTAARIPLPADRIGSAITLITAEDIEERQAALVEEVLRDVPGLAVTQTGNLGSFTEVRIRGAEGNHTLVLIDGMEVSDPGLGSNFDFGGLLTDGIERIEILRGPQSTLYGGDAMGGVISIITKKGDGPTVATARTEAGSLDTARASAHISGSTERYAFSLTGSRYQTNGISQADEDNGNPETDGYENETVVASGSYRVNDRLSLEGVARLVDFSVETDPQEFDLATFTFEKPADGDQRTDALERQGIVRARLELFAGRLENIVSAQKTIRYFKTIQDGAITFVSDADRAKLDYQGNLYLGEAHTVVVGAETEKEEIDTSSQTATDEEIQGYFAQYLVSPLSGLDLSAGIRLDDHQSFGRETTHRLTGSYLLTRTGTRVKGSYGTGFKAPTLTDLFGLFGNPALQPETNDGWDAGFVQSLWGGRASLEVIYFSNKIDNLIQFIAQRLINTGQTDTEGIESALGLRINPNLAATLAYTWTNSKDLATGLELIRRPRHTASAHATWDFRPDAQASFGVRYGGERDDRDDRDFTLPVAIRQVTLSSHTLVDLGLSYQLNERFRLVGRVENLLDDNYEELVDYGSHGISAYAGVQATF